MYPMFSELWHVCNEGAYARDGGRSNDENPYDGERAEAWNKGYDNADLAICMEEEHGDD